MDILGDGSGRLTSRQLSAPHVGEEEAAAGRLGPGWIASPERGRRAYAITGGEHDPETRPPRTVASPTTRSPRTARRAGPAVGGRRGGASRDPPLPYQKSRRRRARRAAQRQRPAAARDAALPPSCTAPGPAEGREKGEDVSESRLELRGNV